MVPLGLWNDKRLPSFFSGVFFCPVSESKRGKVRITFMFRSPQLVTSCRFPAPWVDSSFVNSEWASQPAMWAVSAGPLSFSLSLSLTRSISSLLPLLSLSLSNCPLSLSPPCPPCGAITAAKAGSPRLPPHVASRSRERLDQPPSGHWCNGSEDERRRGRQILLGTRWNARQQDRKVGAEPERGWRRWKGSVIHVFYGNWKRGWRSRNVGVVLVVLETFSKELFKLFIFCKIDKKVRKKVKVWKILFELLAHALVNIYTPIYLFKEL